jgi:hypothetical protein
LTGADLVSYSNCSQFLQQVKSEALGEVGPYGLGAAGQDIGRFGSVGPGTWSKEAVPMPMSAAVSAGSPIADAGSSSIGSTSGDQEYSTTNDQEAGVDEPDLVKTDGRLMVVLRQQPIGVQVVDVGTAAPKLDGFLALPQLGEADGLFLVGQDAVVIGGQTSLTDQSVGDQSTGDQSTGEQSTGEQSTGEQSTGEQSTGDQSTGDQSTGVVTPVPQAPEPVARTGSVGSASMGSASAGSASMGARLGRTGLAEPYGELVNPGGPMIPVATPAPKAPALRAPALRAPALKAPALKAVRTSLVMPVGGSTSLTDIVVVSLADPSKPSVVRTFSFKGEDEGARLINGQVVLVLASQPQLRWVYPVSAAPAAQRAATAANKAAIESSVVGDWLPSETVRTGHGTSVTVSTRATACSGTYHTVVRAGLGTVSVVSVGPLSSSPGSEVTVVGNAENVYASGTDVYVATANWQDQLGPGCPVPSGVACPMEPATPAVVSPATGSSTDIYGFDISDPSSPRYLGSGKVPGTLIGQYAMSEYGGYLRVATTVGEPTPAPVDGGAAPAQRSDNMVSVLQPKDGSLVTVGALSGLGRGEKIYSVRFEGDLGYVVTFNQTDPLYVIDLTNPRSPVLAGKLPLSGYSSFLQPLGNGLLLGVGQSVDQDLRTQGLQIEVLGVADPDKPSLDSRQELGDNSTSEAETDPHALLWWPRSGLVVLPVDDYSGTGPSSAADVWTVGSSGALTRVGTLAQPAPSSSDYGYSEIERAVVVGNDIYTVSEQGVMASDMSSLSRVAWLAYGDASE